MKKSDKDVKKSMKDYKKGKEALGKAVNIKAKEPKKKDK